MQVRYLTQLNTKPRILHFYTPGELIFVMFASLLPFVVEIVLGLPPNIILVFLSWGVLTLVIVLFRIGKPEGYMQHCISHMFTPEEFRPGRVRNSDYIYPVALPYELRNTPQKFLNRMDDTNENA